ncbi:hypothetical protein [Aquimarina litoralis]|uniref:hypothetical protein n=1 Tax=Aquimarina litoralis TaxID=584605 RepID=UPI001C57E577|nr:hypothetical protein [Aquimarina litoralis]MBW1294795.1 hypothetical protein [Aquimarina litoralis]
MNTHTNKIQRNESRKMTGVASQKMSSNKSTFQFKDNRVEAIAQLKMQKMADNSPQVKLGTTQFMKKKGTTLDGAYQRVDSFGNNWSTLDRTAYINKHGLKQQSSTFTGDKYIQNLKDGSIILTDTTGQYWRHEHASVVGQYYDKDHLVNTDNSKTHFWISSKQKKKIQDTVQLKKS